jgi:hypothetical protein
VEDFADAPLAEPLEVANTDSWSEAFFASTLGAGDFLLFVEHQLFKFRLAIVTNVFVDRHSQIPEGSLLEL